MIACTDTVSASSLHTVSASSLYTVGASMYTVSASNLFQSRETKPAAAGLSLGGPILIREHGLMRLREEVLMIAGPAPPVSVK